MIAYFDCFSGISGDMTLGALLDLGVDLKWLQENLYSIPLTDFDIQVSSVLRKGIKGEQVNIIVKDTSHSRSYEKIVGLIEKSPLPVSISLKANNSPS